MPQNVLERDQKLLKDQPDDNHILNMINNYKRALLHPNALDIEAAKVFAKGIAQKLWYSTAKIIFLSVTL